MRTAPHLSSTYLAGDGRAISQQILTGAARIRPALTALLAARPLVLAHAWWLMRFYSAYFILTGDGHRHHALPPRYRAPRQRHALDRALDHALDRALGIALSIALSIAIALGIAGDIALTAAPPLTPTSCMPTPTSRSSPTPPPLTMLRLPASSSAKVCKPFGASAREAEPPCARLHGLYAVARAQNRMRARLHGGRADCAGRGASSMAHE